MPGALAIEGYWVGRVEGPDEVRDCLAFDLARVDLRGLRLRSAELEVAGPSGIDRVTLAAGALGEIVAAGGYVYSITVNLEGLLGEARVPEEPALARWALLVAATAAEPFRRAA